MKHLLLAAALLAAPGAAAEVIYETADPFSGPFFPYGFDIGGPGLQRVGLRFTPQANCRLDRISVWFMSNDLGAVSMAPVVITVETDDQAAGVSVPSGVVLEQLGFRVSALGWDPVLEAVDSASRPLLRAGDHYWIVASSDVSTRNPVWNIVTGSGFVSVSDLAGAWQPGTVQAPVGVIVVGTLDSGCRADIDGDGALTLFDFLAFQNLFAAGDLRADFTGDGVLDLFDFLTFQNEFAAGCP